MYKVLQVKTHYNFASLFYIVFGRFVIICGQNEKFDIFNWAYAQNVWFSCIF